eukprot:366399-Chlamydomonas_euryale.AAC.46
MGGPVASDVRVSVVPGPATAFAKCSQKCAVCSIVYLLGGDGTMPPKVRLLLLPFGAAKVENRVPRIKEAPLQVQVPAATLSTAGILTKHCLT